MKDADDFPLSLKKALAETIRIYKHPKYLSTDPISFPYLYDDPFDQEIVSLLSCLYAYGNVKAIKSFVGNLLQHLGPSPYKSLANKNINFQAAKKQIGYYRFQTEKENQYLLEALSHIAREHSSRNKNIPIFEDYFLDQNHFDVKAGLSKFQQEMESKIIAISKSKQLTRGLRFLIGDPKSKAAKKRLCLFLRWMVRKDFPDFGLYKRILPSDLAFPLDVHIQRLIKILGISTRKTYGLKEGILVRDYFRKLNANDPLLYDYYLTRVGMIQKCRGVKIESICSNCSLLEVCLIGSATGN